MTNHVERGLRMGEKLSLTTVLFTNSVHVRGRSHLVTRKELVLKADKEVKKYSDIYWCINTGAFRYEDTVAYFDHRGILCFYTPVTSQ